MTDESYAALAIEQAAKCAPEDSAKPRPKVGAVVVSAKGELLGASYRGEQVEKDQGKGDHAEYVLLDRKLKGHDLRGATLFTTLEPCVRRSERKTPCAKRVIDAGISHVVVGMLDPNPDITGRGYWQLRRAGVSVALFGGDFQAQVEAQNQTFSDPYRRFDSVFVSDLLEDSAAASSALVAAWDGTRELVLYTLKTFEALSLRPQDNPQMQTALATLATMSRMSAKSVRETLEHLDAMGHSSKRLTRIRSELDKFESKQK